MQGYLNNPTANKEFFTEDGFAKMGDLGYYDEHGRLYFKDRIKEVIKVYQGLCWLKIFHSDLNRFMQNGLDHLKLRNVSNKLTAFMKPVSG